MAWSDLAYFEYALVLPEERYLIEVQTRNLTTGETRGRDELQSVAKEAIITVIGQADEDMVRKLNAKTRLAALMPKA